MGRPPTHGAPSFRFHAAEVAQMESILGEHAGNVPPREFLMSLANQFSNAPERAGRSIVQMKQVWNWFQNRRYALRSKLVKPPGAPNYPQVEVAPQTNVIPFPQQAAPMPSMPSGHNVVRNASESPPMEFEAKSSRDGAWYDVQQFLSQRYIDSSNPEVLVRFSGFGQEEDEWVDVHKRVRHRSLPCESSECTVVLPGDLILCFQEGKEQALYFDAHVLDAQRRRHDVRGCRCRFLVRYDHDQSEEIVPLRKLCRRPETDYRLQLLHSTNDSASASSSGQADSKKPAVDPASTSAFRDPNYSPLPSHTMVNPTAASGQVQAPAQAPFLPSGEAPAPSLTLISSPTPSQILTSDSAPSATQILSSTPVSIQSTISVRNPEVKKIESGSPTASSAGEASARKTAGVIMEVKLEEIDSSRTSTEVAGGSSVPQGEASGNPSESTAPTEGGPSLSAVAERINVLSVSANDTKEGMQGVISID